MTSLTYASPTALSTAAVFTDKPPVARTLAAGIFMAVAGFGGFSAWATLAPLSSAAVAPGIVTADTNRKTVQHLDGGVISEILVRDGDRVEAGQVLMRLDDLETRSVVTLLEGQRRAYAAQEARLLAEQRHADRLIFPAPLTALRTDPEMDEILSGQERIFDSRRASLRGRITVTRQRIAQYDAQIGALNAQLASGRGQSALIREELVGVQELADKGLERKPRLLALKRQAVDLEGEQGEYANRIAQAREAIAESELEIIRMEADDQREVATELREVQMRLAEVREKLASAQVRQGRRDVVAPEAGTVVHMRYFSPGAVVSPGGPIVDLVPRDDRLVIEAKVRPTDIDVVHVGLPAKVIFSAFKMRTTPQLEGTVSLVSADAMTEERTGVTYYTARIAVDAKELAKLGTRQLQPGMPAETMIVTGERTMMEYLLQPVSDTFRAAFREE
jgi:HlyD family type I secretion membrane fusion protein